MLMLNDDDDSIRMVIKDEGKEVVNILSNGNITIRVKVLPQG